MADRNDGWSSPEPPTRVPLPMLHQQWRDVTFLHWPVPPGDLRRLVPAPLELDLADGTAWVSLIAFAMPRIQALFLPPIPPVDSAAEVHLRTYVRGPDGRRGVWFLSLDIDPLPAAVAGRFPFLLPYWWSRMRVDRRPRSVRYAARRPIGRPATLDLDVRIGARYADDALTDLDHFLTARWVLYAGTPRLPEAMLVEHPRWPLRRASVTSLDETMTTAAGLPALRRSPVVHFSDGVDARMGWPRPHLARRAR